MSTHHQRIGRFEQLVAQTRTLVADLRGCESRSMRCAYIEQWAAAATTMAALDSAVHGPGDRAAILAASADVLRLVALAERTVAESDWSHAADLRPGARFWRHGWARVTGLEHMGTGRLAGEVRLHYGARTVRCPAAELVRVDGPSYFTVVERAVDDGAGAEEALWWYHLANTATPAHRAGVFSQLSDITARRVGAAAAALIDLAETEAAIADLNDP
jgi:hypothetical protein